MKSMIYASEIRIAGPVTLVTMIVATERAARKEERVVTGCCDCTLCEKILVLPQDDERCEVPVPTTTTTTTTTSTTTTSTTTTPPEECRYEDGGCVGPCDKGEGDCLNSRQVPCECSLVGPETCECKNPCDEIKYKNRE